IVVGSEPGKLALSDDGRSLYVALDGSAAVRRIDLGTQTAGLQFPLGTDPENGPLFVEDMAALPGAPEAIAVARQHMRPANPRHEGVAIYDSGLPRPTTTPRYPYSDVLQFPASASRLYGFDTHTSGNGVFRRI